MNIDSVKLEQAREAMTEASDTILSGVSWAHSRVGADEWQALITQLREANIGLAPPMHTKNTMKVRSALRTKMNGVLLRGGDAVLTMEEAATILTFLED
ncbi:MAG: hypothetical protein JKY23_06840 [Nitrospinaceae bacterium]|nr:hypothetical protein [Nitrospinaceae bacterium]